MADGRAEISPALTPEEWAQFGAMAGGPRILSAVALDVGGPSAAAAVLLHGQPFGFTWADVDALQRQIDAMRKVARPVGPMHALWESIFDLESIRDRIAALLPPR